MKLEDVATDNDIPESRLMEFISLSTTFISPDFPDIKEVHMGMKNASALIGNLV